MPQKVVDTVDYSALSEMPRMHQDDIKVYLSTTAFREFAKVQRDAAQKLFVSTDPQEFFADGVTAADAQSKYFQFAHDARLLVRFWDNLHDYSRILQDQQEQAQANANTGE